MSNATKTSRQPAPGEILSGLASVGAIALEVHRLALDHKRATQALTDSYVAWKRENGHDRVQRDSEAWEDMMDATADAYKASKEAKRVLFNAQRRLQTACRRMATGQEGGAA